MSPQSELNLLTAGFTGVSRSREVGIALPERALRNSTVHRCVKLLVENLSTIPIRLVDRKTKRTINDHPVSELLVTPNDRQTWVEFAEMYVANLVCFGNAYAEKVIERGRIVGLLPMNGSRTTVESKNGSLHYHYATGAGKVITLPEHLIVHTRLYGTDDLTGMSPLWAAERAILLAMRQEDMLLDIADDGGIPPLIIQVPPEKLLDRLDAQGVSVEQDDKSIQAQINANRTRLALYLPHGYEGTPLSANHQQLQLQESREFAVAEIARIFGITPLSKLGVLSKADSGTNAEAQQQIFVEDTLLPLVVKLEKRFERDLLSPDEMARFQIKMNTRSKMRANVQAQTDQYVRLWQIGQFTNNRINELEDWELSDDPRADMHFYPVNQTSENVEGADQLTNPADGGFNGDVPTRTQRTAQPLTEPRKRSLDARKEASQAARPAFRDAVAKILRKERATVLKDANSILRNRSAANLKDRITALYAGELRGFIEANLRTPVTALFERIRAALQEELGTTFDEGEAQKILREYIRILTRDYANQSLYTLLDAIDDAGTEAEIVTGLESTFDGWENGTDDAASRIERIGTDEPNRIRNVVSRGLYLIGGVTLLRWITGGKPCPICDPLSGAVFSASAKFRLPPQHSGCACSVTSA